MSTVRASKQRVTHLFVSEQECPTIWRLYEYVTDREREAILQHRESKQPLALGEGGEGYIARDEWCYNCGESGHLGDVSRRQVSSWWWWRRWRWSVHRPADTHQPGFVPS
jgi:hypothetical protein